MAAKLVTPVTDPVYEMYADVEAERVALGLDIVTPAEQERHDADLAAYLLAELDNTTEKTA
jgi:hypothetical protein